MRYLGWNLNKVYQTGSNMGTEQSHDNPFLCNIGSGTMISDGVSMINMQMSATSFRLAESKIGDNNFVGNDIYYPPNGRTGNNVLLGTKTMIPIDGPMRENIGLLGSPAFEIPRKVDRDRDVNASFDEQTRNARLRQKNLHNFFTVLIFLAREWMTVFVAFLFGQAAFTNFGHFGVFASFAAIVAFIAVNMVLSIMLDRASIGFRRLKPRLVSIYDPYFWSHERYWKLAALSIFAMFAGTPFRGMLLRAIGMKVGAKLFDGGAGIPELSLVEVGDYANLNEGCVLQAHSLEEGVFKSDYIRLGNRCSLGPGAFLHYGVSTGDNVVIDADSFVMKGETLDSHTGWRGNPARQARCSEAQTEICVQDVTIRNKRSLG
jgi:non-ribosomal peptide synthetase-like protein